MGNAVVLIQPDPFIGVGRKVTSYLPNYRQDTEGSADSLATSKKEAATEFGAAYGDIRYVARPLNGIAAKPNSHAYVQIINSDNKVVSVFNQLGMPGGVGQSGDRGGNANPDFFDPGKSGQVSGKVSAFRHGDGTSQGSAAGVIPKAGLGPMPGTPGSINSPGMGMDKEGNPASTAWTDWILTAVREIRMEKTQLVETFGDSYLYAFGEKPRVLGFSGLLMNTLDYNWRAVFWENWDNYFRATKLIELDARMYIGWEDIVVEGYPIQAVAQESADSPNALSFTFQFYVTNYWNMSMANRMTALAAKNRYRLAMSRSMYQKQGVFDNEIKSDLLSVFDTILGKGAASHAFLLERQSLSLGSLGGIGNTGGELSELDKLALRSLKKAADVLTKLPFKLATLKAANITAFTNAALLSVAFDALKTVGKMATTAAEENFPLGRLKHGEINAWFGYVGALLDTTLQGAFGRWDGDRFGISGFGGVFTDLFRSGSIDRIVQRMSYQVIGLTTGFGIVGRYRAATTEVSITTGSNMDYGAAPGTAVVIHQTPVNASSTTDLSISNVEAIEGTFDQDTSAESGGFFGVG